MRKVVTALGADSQWFVEPVNPTLVPDYYSIISQPMDLGTVQKRLKADHYSNPKEFCEVWFLLPGRRSARIVPAVSQCQGSETGPSMQDVRLVWANCVKYNGVNSVVGKIGTKGRTTFEQLWAGSGFSDEARARRATAGVAAPKYEPAAGIPDKRPKKLNGQQPTKSAGRRHPKSKVCFVTSPAEVSVSCPLKQ